MGHCKCANPALSLWEAKHKSACLSLSPSSGRIPYSAYGRTTGVVNLNLLLAVDEDGGLGQLHYGALQLHGDRADGCRVVDDLSPDLDVEVLVAVFAVGGEDIIAGGRQLEEVPIEGL